MKRRQIAPSAFIFCLLALWSTAILATGVPGPLVEVEWLKENLDDVVLLDVRTSPESFEEKAAPSSAAAVNPCGVTTKEEPDQKVSGHIPGAVFVPWKEVRAETKEDGEMLKGMLPSRPAFDRLMKSSGVSNDSTVVITHNGEAPMDTLMATRLYWTMKYYGHDDMAVLDGGTKQWIKAGGNIEYGKSRPRRGRFRASAERTEILATDEDVAKAIEDGEVQLLDSRDLQDYMGLTYHPKFTSPERKGHVPTAKNWPIGTQVNTKGVAGFYSADDIKKVAEVLDVPVDQPAITYCWSGGQASLSWFVLHEILGNKEARLYDASMHGWTKDASRPLASSISE